MNKIILLTIIIFSLACRPEELPEELQATTLSNKIVGNQNCSQEIFELSDEQATPKTIVDVIDLINILPKPLNIPCFLKTLKRPLFINMTNSKLSAQPALSDSDPRVFIFSERLILSISTSGHASQLLELSQLMPGNNKVSIKGEFKFPILHQIDYDEPFRRIEQNSMTSCSACHVGEQVYFHDKYKAYSSAAVKPITASLINISALQTEAYLCDLGKLQTDRCSIIYSLTNQGQLRFKSFPDDMPTLTESFRN
jgi:hypothetical protein